MEESLATNMVVALLSAFDIERKLLAIGNMASLSLGSQEFINAYLFASSLANMLIEGDPRTFVMNAWAFDLEVEASLHASSANTTSQQQPSQKFGISEMITKFFTTVEPTTSNPPPTTNQPEQVLDWLDLQVRGPSILIFLSEFRRLFPSFNTLTALSLVDWETTSCGNVKSKFLFVAVRVKWSNAMLSREKKLRTLLDSVFRVRTSKRFVFAFLLTLAATGPLRTCRRCV